jgi:histidine ammonia-lyase
LREPIQFTIGEDPLTLQALRLIASGGAAVDLSEAARARIVRGRAIVDRVVEGAVPAYAITVGVGSQKDFPIKLDSIAQYNELLLTGHATIAPGPNASSEIVRGALALQLALFATGRSGVSLELVERLLSRLNADDLPGARLGSSVGASDIVAMSQLGVPIVGKQAVLPNKGMGSAPAGPLKPKEAASLLNSNCLTLSAGTLVHHEIRCLLDAATSVAALTLEGFRGNPHAWSETVDQARGQPGQIRAGASLRCALADSQLWRPGESRFLQDPLSFRCVPQIHGAAEAAYDFATAILQTELSSACDNPLIDLATGTFISHGNMETTACALALDTVRLALAKVIVTSGERIHKIQWPSFSQLPAGLALENGPTGGVQFLNIGHIASACVASVCQAANPAMLNYRGQICDGVEDVGGNAPLAVDETRRAIEPAWNVIAIEAMCAVWAIQRRGVPTAALGRGLRVLNDRLRVVLPIGLEGRDVFDLGVVVNVLKSAFP